ncbi:MAG: type VI secretion system ATPase TssH [Gammaproteobacteria bacterium]|nr:MAG: type VI secretion system ATPase TssH [Gammaproteobacteria bacterium]
MITLNLKSLVGRLNPTVRNSLEAAAGLAMSRAHYEVEIEHWLLKLIEEGDTDIVAILERFEVNMAHLARDLTNILDRLKNGSSRPPSLSPALVDLAKEAWLLASVEYGHAQVTSGHLLAAMMLDESFRRQLGESSKELKDIPGESAKEMARATVGTTSESTTILSEGGTAVDSGEAVQAGAPTKTPSLDKFTINLTERAAQGNIDPVLGRDGEIRQLVDILSRRRQNNPILTGEAGVGKTAVVEGFALRIAQNDVPETLQGVVVRTLDLGLLQAGASVKGEFENRLKSVIDEVKASPVPIIMFIDEAHTLIGAGGKEGQGDAANLMKPALARGEMRTIAATTWAEYKKYFERDPALTRRFQVVKVEEPDENTAIEMMRGIAKALESHHKTRILDQAIIDAVKLSHRYIAGRQLPDKSVSLLDTACAKVSLSLGTTPAAIEDSRRHIDQCTRNIHMLEREDATSGGCQERIAELTASKAQEEARLAQLNEQWDKEKELVQQIREVREKIEADFIGKPTPTENADKEAPEASTTQLSDEERDTLKTRLQGLTEQLNEVQGEAPLMQPVVDGQAVAEVVGQWTGIPVGRMVSDEMANVLNLAQRLNARVIGQDHALEAIAQSIRTSRAGLRDPRKPIGVFFMVGPSGTGKTETALALSEMLYGGEHNVTTINMSEFKEEHKVSMLVGSPPGYVGYGEGGVLTEAVRRKPYSIVLLDEMEKAHHGVQDIFYNVFDKGTIKDGEGRDIDFKNTIIIMTSNAGEEHIRAICEASEEKPEPDVILDNFRPQLLNWFKPAFLGRCDIVPYYPLDDENLIVICGLNMKRIEKRVKEHYGANFSYHEDVPLHIVARSQEVDTGARNIEHIISRTLLPELASECLNRMAEGKEIKNIHINVDEEGSFSYELS